MTRGGKTKDRDEVERKCIATGEVQPKSGLMRFVIHPTGQVIPDILQKLPGRGVWVAAEKDAIEKAVNKGLFSRATKQNVTVPDTLLDDVDTQLARRLVELVSLARKAGQAVAGYEKVKSWLMNDAAKVLLQATDGSERGKSKLRTPEGGRFIGILTASELGLAFGRESVIHGALASGGLSKRVVETAEMLKGVRGLDGGKDRREG
ncbi:RNA-binding protein [Parasulfitobacter algicola]|uniref:RNA-binding protein n=1 Tax=Parasulfitobacter algicola TaxID=2614809 RepID=A0ABX2IUZ8_9RHOB|nr:RNA-binding protein [Sulfitobacter algicola]NSX53873.1 RNA-binding protein [Sulfitobacter algicola]